MIPLTHRHHFLIARHRNQVIERPETAIAIAAKLRIRMMFIIEDLVLHADGRSLGGFLTTLRVHGRNVRLHEDFDAAVAAIGRLEISHEFENWHNVPS